MEPISIISLVAFMKKVVDLFKYVTNKNKNAFVTQVVVWLTGVFTILLARAADITENLEIFNHTLGSFNLGSVILGGMMFSSLASVAYDFQAARDNTDSAKTPSLF